MMKFPTHILPALLLAAPLAIAESTDVPPGPHRGPPIERIAADLGLDDYQKSELERIFAEQHARMSEERALLEASGQRQSREEIHAKFEQSRADVEAQLSAVLTPEQFASFKQQMAERRPPRGTEPSSSSKATNPKVRPSAQD
jgi:Spy/CpxP family protein refolding chaperone